MKDELLSVKIQRKNYFKNGQGQNGYAYITLEE